MTDSSEYNRLIVDEPISRKSRAILLKKIGSAVFYAISSFLITVVNKTVLTSWSFPSFWMLSVGQIGAAIIILYAGKQLKIIKFPSFSLDIPMKIFPLPLVHFGNMMFGLGATQALSLPMFTAIRRISILMTMFLEKIILNVQTSLTIQLSVWSMIFGALIAAWNDLKFSFHGYSYVMIVNVMTAANGVYLKQKLDTIDIGKYGIMFYNSILIFIPALIGAILTHDFEDAINYPYWANPLFLFQFVGSCIMGFVLMYSNLLCTQYNSALTTSIIGCLKNVSVSYLGMFIGGDYVFTWWNCFGINISVIGSLVYTYLIFFKDNEQNYEKNEIQKTENV